MNTLKRIFVGIIIIIIVLCAVFYSYSAIENGAVVLATNQDGTLTNDELDVAITSWLESHGGNIFSPQNYRARKTYEAGLLHNFIYGDGGGYDAIRQHINGGVGGNNELKFDFDGFIIQKLNTWLNNELQNGTFGQGAELNENGMFEDGIDNTLYSGKYFTDDDGNSCLVYITDQFFSSYAESTIGQFNVRYGTPYKYTGDEINTLYTNGTRSLKFNINENEYSYGLSVSSGWLKFSGAVVYYRGTNSNYKANGNPAIVYNRNEGKFYIGSYSSFNMNSSEDSIAIEGIRVITSNNNNTNDSNIIFYTNNNNNVNIYPTIVDADGHLYITPKVNVGLDGEVNYQPYIINEGDTINNVINQYYIDSNTPDKTISYPTDNPDDNGGGGGNDNPSGGTPPDWSNNYPHLSPDGEGGFNFNFTLPDLNIDWNISGLSEKFPFSIPFDLLAFCRILDAEPETPRFEGDLVLPMLTYHIDLNLERFDTIAQLLRNLEFVGFCIGLILITRSMIKG